MAFTGVLVGTLFVSVIRVNSGGMRFAVSCGLAFMCALVPLSIKLYGTPLLAYREVTHYLTGSRDRVRKVTDHLIFVNHNKASFTQCQCTIKKQAFIYHQQKYSMRNFIRFHFYH